MKSLDKRNVILRKVLEMKRGGFKATAIKVELEAQFDRDDYGWTERECYNFIMERLEPLGLAVKGDLHYVGHSDTYETSWHCAGPLVYAEFYDDGSVDSEFTFTIMIDNPENVFAIPKVVAIFKQLGEEIGGDIGTWKAGMHTAILNDPKGAYPVEQFDEVRFSNFQRSMTLLLPSLYFLASNCSTSRSLEYRQPRIASPKTEVPGGGYYDSAKYSAIFYSGGALEYRIFETCYDNPDTILDNLVVIANTLRYWRKKYRPSGLSKLANEVKFGIRDGNNLDRFYRTSQHIDLLNAGLRKLKPAYYSIKEIKEARNFTQSKRRIGAEMRQCMKQALKKYDQYKASRQWESKVYAKKVEAEFLESFYYNNSGTLATIDMDAKMEELKANAEKHFLTSYDFTVKSPEDFVADALKETVHEGKFLLSEEAPAEQTSTEEEAGPFNVARMSRIQMASYVEALGTQNLTWRA